MISVIIPVYDDPDGIKRTLDSIKNQESAHEYEIIVTIDDTAESESQTKKVAEDFKQIFGDKISILKEKEKQNSFAARNLGIKEAKGNVLCFIDAGVILGSNFLSSVKKNIDKGLILGYEIENKVDTKNIWSFYVKERHFPVKRFANKDEFVPTACLVVPREAVENYGEFEEHDGADREFCHRLVRNGYDIEVSGSAKVQHLSRDSFWKLKKRWIRVGEGYSSLNKFRLPSERPWDMNKWASYSIYLKLSVMLVYLLNCFYRVYGYIRMEVKKSVKSIFNL